MVLGQENFSSDETLGGQRAAEDGLIGAIATWCEFLHNKARATDALKQIADGLCAEAVVLSRVSRQSGGQSRVTVFDRSAGHSRALILDRSYAYAVLGNYFDRAKPGSIWRKSMLEEDVDPDLSNFHNRRGLVDLAVIPLESGPKQLDFVEIHFPFKLQFQHHALLNTASTTLVRTWKNRDPGIVIESVMNLRPRASNEPEAAAILSAENPARLSRAEYRVCLLLSCGQTVESAQQALGVKMPTLRTHLKNIYAKTNTSCQSELVYRLLTHCSSDRIPDQIKHAG